MNQRQRDDRGKTSVRQLAEYLLPLVGITAAITYAILRLAYAHFYYKFDVAPEEVGLEDIPEPRVRHALGWVMR